MAGRTTSAQALSRRCNVATRIRKLLALWRPALNLALAAGLLADFAGCTRSYYRKSADEEVAEVLAQKDKYPAWAIQNWHVYPDPQARFADPTNPDRPPMPPDDPAACALSPNPQKPGKAGVARVEGGGYLELIAGWDRENRERRAREEAEDRQKEAESPTAAKAEAPRDAKDGHADNDVPRAVAKDGPTDLLPVAFQKPAAPDAGEAATMKAPPQQDAIAAAKARSLLDISGRPAFLLTLDQAAELAMFNSREYQDQREDLYLAALPVTEERFSFVSQLFAAQEAIRAYAGREAPGGPTNNWTLNNGTGLNKILPTGALLLLNFSNQTVFEFLNPKKTLSNTTLSFDAIQPLLRGAGEAVALEALTQAERNLLYQVRNYARFRKELYVAIASSSGGSINGGAFQPTGVLVGGSVSSGGLGASGLIPGVVPRTNITIGGPLDPPSSPGRLNLTRAITPPPSGYLNTMLQKIQVYIDQENIDILIDILQRYRGLLEGDVVAPLQVQNVEQQLLSGRATILLDQQQYLQALDAFKLEIGVPMQLSIEMDDSVLQPLLKQFKRARAIIDNERAAVREASALIDLDKAPRLRAELRRLFTRSALVRGTTFAGTIRERWAEWEKLSTEQLNNRLDELRKEIQALLDRQADLQRKGEALTPAEEAKLRDLNSRRDLGSFERALRQYELNYIDDQGKPKKPADAPGERLRIRQFQSVISSWQKVLVEARDEQWEQVRQRWPDLPRACVDGVDLINANLDRAQAAAAQHALENRLDLMNVRSQLVDAWRQLAIYANALLGTFTVRYHLDASSPPRTAQPLNIGGSGTAHELILDTQLPLVRQAERNNYRASLIAYQRQRRALQESEDLAVQVVHSEVFILRQLTEAYRVQKRQLELAYLTIDNSLEALQAPTAPGRSATDGPAALTQQLLSAQRSLPTAQNALLSIWINYLNARLQLYRDLELMPLDARGVWIDEIRDCDCGVGAAAETPELLPAPATEPRTPERLPAPQPVPPVPPHGMK